MPAPGSRSLPSCSSSPDPAAARQTRPVRPQPHSVLRPNAVRDLRHSGEARVALPESALYGGHAVMPVFRLAFRSCCAHGPIISQRGEQQYRIVLFGACREITAMSASVSDNQQRRVVFCWVSFTFGRAIFLKILPLPQLDPVQSLMSCSWVDLLPPPEQQHQHLVAKIVIHPISGPWSIFNSQMPPDQHAMLSGFLERQPADARPMRAFAWRSRRPRQVSCIIAFDDLEHDATVNYS